MRPACTRTVFSPPTACCASAARGNIWIAAISRCWIRIARTYSDPCMTFPIDDPHPFATLPRRRLGLWPGSPDLAGVDEAGCAPLAGPVVVAAVILDPARRINGLDDSKVLNEPTREKLYARIV